MPLPPPLLDAYPRGPASQGTGAVEPRPAAWPARLGWVPNFKDWRLGDILVMERLPGPSLVTAGMEAYQKARAQPAARGFADCTHCAVVVGDGLIADSRPGRLVSVRRLWPETLVRRMALLRWDSAVVTGDEVQAFVEAVIDLEDLPYAATPFAFARWHNNTFLNHTPAAGLVCSALVEYAAKTAGIAMQLAPGVQGPALPASLLCHP